MINLLKQRLKRNKNNKKYYSKQEVDALIKELNDKIDNLKILSKEEIELMINKKEMIVDPPPYYLNHAEIINLVRSIIDTEAVLKIDYEFLTDKKINSAIDAMANRIKMK